MRATIKLPIPAHVPFITTISKELLLLIIFVQLFSNPQHKHAPKIYDFFSPLELHTNSQDFYLFLTVDYVTILIQIFHKNLF